MIEKYINLIYPLNLRKTERRGIRMTQKQELSTEESYEVANLMLFEGLYETLSKCKFEKDYLKAWNDYKLEKYFQDLISYKVKRYKGKKNTYIVGFLKTLHKRVNLLIKEERKGEKVIAKNRYCNYIG